MGTDNFHQVSIEGTYYDRYGTAGFIRYLKCRGIDMYRYKVIASPRDYAYFSKEILENHRKEYGKEMEQRRKGMEQRRKNGQKVAEESQRQHVIQEVKSRLLREPTPAAAKAIQEFEAVQDILPDPPQPKAVDLELLELLLPGYRSKSSKDFSRPDDAPLYEPLPGADWFRLLVIEPWKAENHGLRCHLRAVRHDDAAGKYSALSYCWTQPVQGAVQGLVCNGVALAVGENLRLALSNIRYSTLPKIVWVDALCINQADIAERNQQVQLMGKIYQHAVQTIIWLGDIFPHRPTRPEFDAICKVVKSWDRSLSPYYKARNGKGKLCCYKPSISRNRSSLYMPESFDAGLVSKVFGSPWFERRWVIQEVALSHSVVVKVPDATIQWRWIGLAAGVIRTNHTQLISSYRMPNIYNAYFILRLSTYGHLAPLDLSLLSLLRLTTGFKTTNKLDVVFALLGILNRQVEGSESGSAPETLRVDYNLSESQLGILVAENHMMQHRRPLSFLSDAIGVSQKPTWSPRWTDKIGSMLDPWSLNSDGDAFNPAKGLGLNRGPSTDPSQLKVEGVQLSQVAWRTVTFSSPEDFDSTIADLIRMIHRFHGDLDIWNASVVPAVALAFCGERDSYGGRAKDLGHLATQFSDFIWTWLRCHQEAFPEFQKIFKSERFRSVGDTMTWIDAAEIVCLGRCLFYTTSGYIGLGPGEMVLDDTVCILGGTVMPIIVRRFVGHFGIVGDCYLNGVMDGEAVDNMAQGGVLCGPIPVGDTERRAQLRYEPLQLKMITFC